MAGKARYGFCNLRFTGTRSACRRSLCANIRALSLQPRWPAQPVWRGALPLGRYFRETRRRQTAEPQPPPSAVPDTATHKPAPPTWSKPNRLPPANVKNTAHSLLAPFQNVVCQQSPQQNHVPSSFPLAIDDNGISDHVLITVTPFPSITRTSYALGNQINCSA